jgi:hypothetical protein
LFERAPEAKQVRIGFLSCCQKQLVQMGADLKEMQDTGARLVAISCDCSASGEGANSKAATRNMIPSQLRRRR